ncbi:MAG TPA: NAD(P)/FAD-dependent oxidoreductase [Aggregatilineales bacterium]|nr:NAD(P)/FAD-dependent oxidoreductase [Aggregatilineales bacterium]
MRVVIIGAGAAGLMASTWAARTHPDREILLLDGAEKLGAKILVSGGGRCNVTHDQVDEDAYAGSSHHAIRKVLRRFDVLETVEFFRDLGVELKREATGKLFPVSDSARTVLKALLTAAGQAGVVIQHPRRVDAVARDGDPFRISGRWGGLEADRVILACGGQSLPKTGSDGGGYALARSLGHAVTDRLFPALVPLTLPRDHFLCALSGLTVQASLDLHSGTGRKLRDFTDSTLCTHFGLSGPSVLNMSRYYIDALYDDPGAHLTINWLPGTTSEAVDGKIAALGRTSILNYLNGKIPDRLIRALCAHAGIEPGAPGGRLTRERRKALVEGLTALPLPITGNRGYNYAEVTAGGIPLSEIRLESMESRCCSGLFLCGEICDVDGRIGGYNFQWAWSSGFLAGISV